MQQRISIISLGVRDLNKAKAFYNSLGWKIANEDMQEEIIAYNLQSMTLCLYPTDKLAEDVTADVRDNESFSPFTIAYNVDTKEEVADILTLAQKAGGKIIKPAQDVFWGGHSGYFADPDNHLWEVAYNPFSPLGPNGEFQWGGYKA